MQITHKARLTTIMSLLVALALVVPLAPASADAGAFAIAGQARLTGGLGTTGTGCFNGTAVGIHGTTPAVAAPASATVATYDNRELALGTASGVLTVAGQSVNYSWLRIGATAVLTFSGSHGGAAVAAFAPTNVTVPGLANPSCGGALTAQVAGVGIIT